MGYETKLIVGIVCGQEDEKGRKWFSIDAEINMCKCGYDSNLNSMIAHDKEKELVFWYGSDGNTIVAEDRYGDKPIPLPIDKVINALEQDTKESDYRRFKWALNLLNAIKETNENEEFKVLLFGY